MPVPANFKGKKGRSGRKSDAEIVRHYLDTKLADSLINDELKQLQDTPIKKRPHFKIKDVVMPITLKGLADKSEVKNKIQIKDEDLANNLADKLSKILSKKK